MLLGFLQRVDEGVRSTNTSDWDTYVQASGDFSLGHALMWDKQGRLAVQVADEAEADNTLPITAAAVHTELGNIEILLQTI